LLLGCGALERHRGLLEGLGHFLGGHLVRAVEGDLAGVEVLVFHGGGWLEHRAWHTVVIHHICRVPPNQLRYILRRL